MKTIEELENDLRNEYRVRRQMLIERAKVRVIISEVSQCRDLWTQLYSPVECACQGGVGAECVNLRFVVCRSSCSPLCELTA